MEFEDLDISKLEVKDGEFVIVKMDYKKKTQEELKHLYDGLKQIFSKNEIIIIPNDIEMLRMSKEELIEYIENMC